MLELVAAFIEEHHLLPEHGTVVVAVSGGADSLCLLHILKSLCGPTKRYPRLQIKVAHLNHQLRGAESVRDAAVVAKIAADWQLPLVSAEIDVYHLATQEHRSLEDAARLARYRFLRAVAQEGPIAVAHHQDDQVETLLLHWLRGGGIASMIGLQPRQQDIIRPLLAVQRADILDYCRHHQINAVEDSSNSDTRFLRNRIRHELLPDLETINPGFRETLLRSAEVMQVDFAWINQQIDAHWSAIVVKEEKETIQLSIPRLRALPLSLQRHLLRRVSAHLCDGQSPLEIRHYTLLERLQERQATSRNLTIHLPARLHAIRQGDILSFKHISGQVQSAVGSTPNTEVLLPVPGSAELTDTPWKITATWLPEEILHQVLPALRAGDWQTVWQLLPATSDTVYLDAESLPWQRQAASPLPLLVRTRRDGDRIQPLGMHKEKKVKDILIDRHMPREERTQVPLIFSEQHCIWLGGVQLDQRVRLTSQTCSILRLSINQKSH